MIRIQKNPAPALFNSEAMRQTIKEFELSQAADISVRRQSRALPRFPRLSEVRKFLFKESHGKCVYCEQKLAVVTTWDIDRYRPARGAIDANGERSDDHYYWLAFRWENLFASCPECNRAKGTKFPVANQRIPLRVGGALDETEAPMLLNPANCHPEVHLQFRVDGTVTAKSLQGQFTIDILRLNRAALVEARAAHVRRLRLGKTRLEDIIGSAEFAGATRQLLKEQPARFGHTAESAEALLNARELHAPPVAAYEKPDLDSASMTPEVQERQRYYASFPLIRSIEIDGLFGLSNIRINVPPSSGGRPPCMALLGENGVGKSSILKCLALALYDSNALETLGVDYAAVLSDGASEGYVTVTFDTLVFRKVKITREGVQPSEVKAVPILLLAYGPTRLLPTKHHEHAFETEMSQARNLFDPYVPLRDPAAWLNSLSLDRFDFASATIKALLQLDNNYQLHRTGDPNSPISLENFGKHRSLDELSHGYKGVLALACDVMGTLFSRWQSIDAAQGLVLIDELENHLHPSWKLRIVESLRTAFPRVQFFITTHDPLCLRGFEGGEVALLRRESGAGAETIVLQSLPTVSDMRIDQILTSSYFGLRSTVDPKVESLFNDYYELLEDKDHLSDGDLDRLERLRGEVAAYDIPALLPRDRVMYAVIDKYLAMHDNFVPHDPADFDEELKSLVNQLADGSFETGSEAP